jgi:hypothetical protein
MAAMSGGQGSSTPTICVENWDTVCEWVLGFPLNLWQELFHVPFMSQCKLLLEADFQHVGVGLWGVLSVFLFQWILI